MTAQMPSGDDLFSADRSPRREPLTYPGVWPPYSSLVTQDAVLELRDRNGNELTWDESGPHRLGACRVPLEPTELDHYGLSHAIAPYLGTILEESNVPSIDARIPVLAIGSNASPAQLRHKFDGRGVPLLIPSVRARVSGIQVGFGAFIAPAGYVPATVFPDARNTVELAVQWLDVAQLREIDATESPRYRRVWLDESAGVEVLLETGERLGGMYAYVATGGLLGSDGAPWVMGVPGASRPSHVAEELWFPDQASVMERLQRSPVVADALGSTPAEFLERQTGLPDKGVEIFASAGFTIPENRLAEISDSQGDAPRRYRALLPRPRASADGSRVVAIASSSPDAVSRDAQSVVRLDPELTRALGAPRHVEIASAALVREHGDAAPKALAVVLPPRQGDAPAPAHGSGIAQVDHVLRMAAGVVVGEEIIITPADVRRRRWPDAVLGHPNYVTFRVTLADPSSAERDVCLMSGLSLQLLGVSSGDHVVLEGSPDDTGRVASVVLKAFETPDSVWDERQRVTGGGWGTRFPGAREALGVHPDIPTVFIDSATRTRLGISGRELASVRGRPARLQQFGNEMREVMLVLVIALIGIVGLFSPDPVLSMVLLGAIILITLALTVQRLRRRLSHTLDRGLRRRR